MNTLEDAVIIDIDGTLANISHRRPLLERFPVRNEEGLIIKHTKPDWKAK